MIIRFLSILLFLYSNTADLFANRCLDDNTQFRERPDLDYSQECVNTSGTVDFMIHYDTLGSFAIDEKDIDENGIPDYIDLICQGADSVKKVLNIEMGYLEEYDDTDDIYDIYIDIDNDGSSSLWGQHVSDGIGSYIRMRDSYEGMSERCSSEKDKVWLTIAHEFFHAIQKRYNSNAQSYFKEMTSMWFEAVFVPSCYDFLDFVESSGGIFQNPERNFNHQISASWGYSLSMYPHYLSHSLGEDIMKVIWEDYNSGAAFLSLQETLEEQGTTFANTWIDFMSSNIYNSALSADHDIYYHPSQADSEPIKTTLLDYKDYENLGNIELDNESVSIISFDVARQSNINIDHSFSNFIGRHSILSSNQNNSDIVDVSSQSTVTHEFNPLDTSLELHLINAINSDTESYMDFTFSQTPIQFQSLYPNPSDGDYIRLLLDLDRYYSDIRISVYNMLGQVVNEIEIGSLVQGEHDISMHPYIDERFPSGVYAMKIDLDDSTSLSKKFTIIK